MSKYESFTIPTWFSKGIHYEIPPHCYSEKITIITRQKRLSDLLLTDFFKALDRL